MKTFIRHFGLLVWAAIGTAAIGQTWPDKPIRLVVPYAAGGPTDVMGRQIASRLSAKLGQTIVVDNKPGAGGVIGVDAVVKAPADGYTLGLIAPGPVAGMPALTKVPYTHADIEYITLVARSTAVIVGSASGAKSLPELIQAAKQLPGKLNYGSAGNGTSPHIGGEMLKQEAGIFVTHVPYRGSGPAVTAVMGGEIQFTLIDVVGALPLAQAGKLRMLATASSKRVPQTPDVPSTAELGLPNVLMDTNYGLIAPRGVPSAVLRKVREATIDVVNAPDMQAYFTQQGVTGLTTTPDEYRALMQAEQVRWTKVIVKGNLKLD
ncbi:tripartite tricarboxylate transporter substrate binding protein [uncultured Hydrogenophaga sp.]|uniref:Bug family tripartite tricarboxylate transporter substrate binding protein n=1 Tax=uncultured Hydrogenophaga sp. TaxID=199683 RepID=UPI002588FF70|nr:tripartite tricarboxylate transporter substrate binding protein [uncultured Hydrogenophaga sp.]